MLIIPFIGTFFFLSRLFFSTGFSAPMFLQHASVGYGQGYVSFVHCQTCGKARIPLAIANRCMLKKHRSWETCGEKQSGERKIFVPRLFEEKRRDTVFGFPWCVARGAWCMARGSEIPCPLNSSHSFCRILLKLYRCFKDGLKICMWFFSESWNYFLSLFTHFELRHFLSSNITEVYTE